MLWQVEGLDLREEVEIGITLNIGQDFSQSDTRDTTRHKKAEL